MKSKVETWKDSAGAYVSLEAELIINGKKESVTCFTSSDYVGRLIIFKGHDADFFDENVLFDEDVNNICDSSLLSIYSEMINELEAINHRSL